jgi:hypothetical protein
MVLCVLVLVFEGKLGRRYLSRNEIVEVIECIATKKYPATIDKPLERPLGLVPFQSRGSCYFAIKYSTEQFQMKGNATLRSPG